MTISNSLCRFLRVKEVFLSWIPRADLIPTTIPKPQCIESPHIQTGIWTRAQTILYLQKKYVIQALTHRAKMLCSTSELLVKEMDYLHKVLCRNSYSDLFLKNQTMDCKWLKTSPKKTKKKHLSQSPTSQGLVRNFEGFLRTPKSK